MVIHRGVLILLKMLQTEPDFDLDIKEDVEEECSKYGQVEHIFVDK
jgi:RNA-binding protein 39